MFQFDDVIIEMAGIFKYFTVDDMELSIMHCQTPSWLMAGWHNGLWENRVSAQKWLT